MRLATGQAFTDEELDDILDRLLRKAARQGKVGDPAALRAAAEELTREQVLTAAIERRLEVAAARSRDRRRAQLDGMGPAVGDEADRLKAFNVGSERQGMGASFSVDAEGRGRTTALWGDVEKGLRDAGLLARLSAMRSPGMAEFERKIAREMARLNNGDVAPTGDADALKAAEIFNAAIERGRLMQNDAGAWIGKLSGYVVRQGHDRLRVAGGFWREFEAAGLGAVRDMKGAGLSASRRAFREWRQFIEPKLDPRTFDGLEMRDLDEGFAEAAAELQAGGAIDDATNLREVFLYRAWADIVAGRQEVMAGMSDVGEFRPPASKARSVSKSRVLHFSSPDAWMDYHERFGRGSLLANVMGDLERAAKNSALMERWGPAPDAAFENELTRLASEARKRGDAAAEARVMNLQRRAEFGELTGEANRPENLRVAIVGRTIRLQQSMAKLGGMVLSALSDVSLASQTMKRAGAGYLTGYDAAFKGILRLQGDEGKQAADLLDVGARSAAAHLTGRFHVADGPLGWTAQAQRLFYRVNLFEAWQDGLRRGVAEMYSAHLGTEARVGWGALQAGTRETLERYGIDAGAWELARRGLVQPEAPRSLRQPGPDTVIPGDEPGRRYFTFEAIDAIPDRDLLKWRGLTGKDATPDAARRAREDMRVRFQAMVHGILDDAMTEARARERSALTRGTRAGTVWGEAVRSFVQFWSFSAAVVGRHVAPAARGYAGQQPVALLAHLIVASTVLGYGAMQAKQIAKGREPRPLFDEDGEFQGGDLVMAAMLQGGGLGIYGDFLFGEANRNGVGFSIGSLAGPAVGEMERMATILRKALSGDPDQIEDIPGDLMHAAKANTPFLNLFYARTALDYLVLWRMQEAVSPGWLERYERRVEDDQGSGFLVEPTSVL